LVEHWTLSSKELDLISGSKTDHNLLGAACLLKYFQYEGRFLTQKQDVPPIVIVHLAQQLSVVPGKINLYDYEGRSIKAHLPPSVHFSTFIRPRSLMRRQ